MQKYKKVENKLEITKEVSNEYSLKDLKDRKLMLESEKEAIIKNYNFTIEKYDLDIANLGVLIEECNVLNIID
jgi:hypothetical protein